MIIPVDKLNISRSNNTSNTAEKCVMKRGNKFTGFISSIKLIMETIEIANIIGHDISFVIKAIITEIGNIIPPPLKVINV